MKLENLYRMANSMTSTLETPDREDIIQDAVFYCWQTLQTRTCNVSYIYKRLKTQILNGIKRYERQAQCIPTEDIEQQIISEFPEIISLPLQTREKVGLTKVQRRTIEALIMSNFERDTAAEELGLKKGRVSEHWRRAKPVLQMLYRNSQNS